MWNPFKTKKQLLGIKIFISEELDSAPKTKIVMDFSIALSHIIDLNLHPRIHHEVTHVDITKDNATVYYLEFDKPRNWYGDGHYVKKYNTMIKSAWGIAEEKNFLWDKFEVDVYPVIS